MAAHLRRNVPTEIVAHSDFDSTNRTVQDSAWDAPELEPWNNFVALDEDYTIEMGLPHSQRWPWDHSKGAYILTSAHELHCVVSHCHSCLHRERQSTYGSMTELSGYCSACSASR